MNSPFILVIFGATGDLTRNKLMPSIFSLFRQGQLSEDFYIIGFARRSLNEHEFTQMFPNLSSDPKWADFAKHIHYMSGTFEEDKGYQNLTSHLEQIDQKHGACITRFFYLAIPPDNYNTILDKLKFSKLAEGCGHGSDKWTRIIIEKPFGKDLESAKALDMKLSEIFEERQIFRVDHYLAKETVQNMIAFRFANGIFEPVWNNKYIDHVQITWGEKKGVSGRGKFFDGVGILRDVAQNHLLQLLATVAMEQPKSFSKEDVRDARSAAIKALQCISPEKVSEMAVRGQYEGYTKEKDVAADSKTETFVALKAFVDTERFSGVPFYIRAGKEVPEDVTEISIVFIQTCHLLFKEYGCPEIGNVLRIRIQPNEGIGLRVIAKKPGSKVSLGTVDMKFSYHEEFGGHGADAYEKLLMDIFAGDQMLFNRSDELSASWEFITEILKGWEMQNKDPNFKLPIYNPGEFGPKDAFSLIERDNRKWL